MENLTMTDLIRKRGVHKSAITRAETFVNDENNDFKDVNLVRNRLELLMDAWNRYCEVQFEIQTKDSSELHENDITKVEEQYCRVKAKLESFNDSNVSANSLSTASNGCNSKLIELPSIKLPTFTGSYTEWIHFRDIFTSLIIENNILSDIQKFHYLNSSLADEAKMLIENIPPSSNNFEVAWNLIFKRYNNTRLIIQTHVRRLLNLPLATKESASNIRQLVNHVRGNMDAINAIKEVKVPLHELLIVQLIVKNLDAVTTKSWELKATGEDPPSLNQLLCFLDERGRALENIDATKDEHLFKPDTRSVRRVHVATKNANSCVLCKEAHPLYKCKEFLKSDNAQRQIIIKRFRLCFNCMLFGHVSSKCKAQLCTKCRGRHHLLLHREETCDKSISNTDDNNKSDIDISRTKTCCSFKGANAHCLLATALLYIRDRVAQTHLCRALLDSGSQSNFVTETLVQRLQLQKHKNDTPIQGINDVESKIKHCVTANIESKDRNFNSTLSCLVLPRITGPTPTAFIDTKGWDLPTNISLADPHFYSPDKIDLLIGAELYFDLLVPGELIRNPGFPTLINTKFGWILSGNIPTANIKGRTIAKRSFLSKVSIEDKLERFWEIEQLHDPIMTAEEKYCEEHFQRNTTRDNDGRYIVRLPFKYPTTRLGNSLQGATSRLLRLETRLKHSPQLREDYTKFLDEYIQLGHMRLVAGDLELAKPACFLPHHPVLKKESTTTKTRVVFDASFKTTSGISLNDILHVGPTIQEDLCSIFMRFRTHRICFTADVAKMYRQVTVHEDCTPFQRIVWRKDPNDDIQQFELKTVTYGTASAPFLAIRCFKQLAEDEGHKFPEAAKILTRDMYVDDCLSGAEDIDKALLIQTQMIALLRCGGFHLRKWSSNHPDIINNVPKEDREIEFPLNLSNDSSTKTLGLLWHPATDKLLISHQVGKGFDKLTKKSVLSTIASIFDPLGLISPIVIVCKIFMQSMWSAKLDWDDQLPDNLCSQWKLIYSQLPSISDIQIDRHVLVKGKITAVQLHGFADASEKAFGACVYLYTGNDYQETKACLISSKSRVAPLKKLTIPRLELCGCVLLVQLMQKVIKAINLDIDEIHLWTDSTVVLAWIAAPATRWKTFVANRVTTIQELSKTALWHHVSTLENPADLITRGVSPRLLKNNDLWWNGPNWLHYSTSYSEFKLNEAQEIPEENNARISLLASIAEEWSIVPRFSSLAKLKRTVALCLRFVQNCRQPKKVRGPLTYLELRQALNCIIRNIQQSYFRKEIAAIKSSSPISSKSELNTIMPFLDQEGILRVTGRLQKSLLPFENKFQIILPRRGHLTKLIVVAEHQRLLHAGPQLLISALRQRYWIPRIRNTVKDVIRKCIVCFKLKAETAKQLMGNLPTHRARPARAFLNSGIDYAGPIQLKALPRSKTSSKAYIAVFVCFSTKAIHIEIVSDLTSESFIAALRRFISRRGRCQNLYSDNGTNFVGANSQLKELWKFLHTEKVHKNLQDFAAGEQFMWHFIPPSSPHFGGLWEASVKSLKFHLRRATSDRKFTYEELSTLLCQVEACLNSRPLSPIYDDNDEYSFLTPGHFLIGENMTSLPEYDLIDVPANRLSRWQQLQRVMQTLWRRWSAEYLNTIQQRTKWRTKQTNLTPGTLVLIKEDLPPLHWRTGVIEQIHPGEDNLVRVVTVRTKNGLLKRPIHKLCPFPE